MPVSATVWAVELAADSILDEVVGTLALDADAVVFTPREQGRAERRYALADVVRARRVRGSPVLVVTHRAGEAVRRTAFYFVQPPPLEAPSGSRRQALGPFATGSTRKGRRRNASYLGLSNRQKKQEVREWEQAVGEALRRRTG